MLYTEYVNILYLYVVKSNIYINKVFIIRPYRASIFLIRVVHKKNTTSLYVNFFNT